VVGDAGKDLRWVVQEVVKDDDFCLGASRGVVWERPSGEDGDGGDGWVCDGNAEDLKAD
jgi:hypothetical protein